jgi:actin-related protein 6
MRVSYNIVNFNTNNIYNLTMPPKKRITTTNRGSGTKTATKSEKRRRIAATPAAAEAQVAPTAPPRLIGPLPTLILDTGGWNIKHAVIRPVDDDNHGDDSIQPTRSPNLAAKPKHQLTTLISSQINNIQNKSQLSLMRPMERGYVTDLGTQFKIWDFILNLERLEARHLFSKGGVKGVMPSANLGPKSHLARTSAPLVQDQVTDNKAIFTHTAALFCLVQPFTPRCILEREDEVWFRDFGFGRVGRRLGACCSAYKYLKDGKGNNSSTASGSSKGSQDRLNKGMFDDETACCCVIDCGFSMTSIVPTINACAIRKGIKRIQVGGKLMTNLLKQTISYRKFNMMDEFYIINEAKESLCFVSMDFTKEMKNASSIPEGRRWFDREFVLPDFVETFQGSIRLPPMLKQLQEEEKKIQTSHDNHVNGNDEEEYKTQECVETRQDKDVSLSEEDGDDMEQEKEANENVDNDESSDEETQEQAKKRILEQKNLERQRREQEVMDRQILCLSVERFAIPEVLFRPLDIGMTQLGIADAIVQSIESCEPIYRPALYQNIVLTGGNAKIPNLKERLEVELRSIAPSNVKIRVYLPSDPETYAWDGARHLVRDNNLSGNIYLERADWELRHSNGDTTGEIWNSTLNSDLPDNLTVI